MEPIHFNKSDDSVKLSKVLLGLLELHREFGSRTRVVSLIKEPGFWKNRPLKSLGLRLYVDFREGQLFNKDGQVVSLLRSRSSRLVEFGLATHIRKDYNVDSPFHSPRLFSFQYDLLRIEACLNVRIVIYSRSSSGRLYKLRDERSRDSFNYYDPESFESKPEVYELILATKKNDTQDTRLALYIMQNKLDYDPLRDEEAFIARPLYGRVQSRVVYSFKDSSRCHLKEFHQDFLTRILYMISPPKSKMISLFKERCANIQKNHVCEQVDRVCFRIDALELIPRIFFSQFPRSISFSGYLGEKWIYSSESTRISHIKRFKYLNPERERLKMDRMKVEQFMRYNTPRGEKETEDSYFSRVTQPADVVVICSDDKGSMYMASKELGAHIVKNTPVDDRTPLTKEMLREEKANLKLLGDFLKKLKEKLTLDKEELHGEEGFCREKDKSRYKEELAKQIDAKGEDFRDHCSVCDKVPQMLRGMKAGGFQKLYVSDISPKLLLESLCMNTEENKRLLAEACSLSCASFDSESMLEPREDDIRFARNASMTSKSYSGCKKNSQAMFAPFQDLENADPKAKLSLQIPIFLGASDAKMIEKDGEEPAIFGWSSELRPYPEAAILKMCEEFISHVLKRQMVLFRAKFELLKPLMDFLQSYHKPIIQFYTEQHNISIEDVFPAEVCGQDDESGILTSLEELFYAENLTELHGRMKVRGGLSKIRSKRKKEKGKKKKKKEKKKKAFLDDGVYEEESESSSEDSAEDNESESGELCSSDNSDCEDESDFDFEGCEFGGGLKEEEEDEEMTFYRTLNEGSSKETGEPSGPAKEFEEAKRLRWKVERAIKHQKDIKKLWKENILGKLESSLVKLCARLCYFCLNMQVSEFFWTAEERQYK